MGFSEAVRTCFGKYVTFSGRAARPEYWWFVLFVFLVNIALSIVDRLLFGVDANGDPRSVLSGLFSLAVLLPMLAAGWRRMHDTGRPGWWLLLPMIISIGGALFLVAGIFAFAGMEAGGADGEALAGPAAVLGVGGMIVYAIVQIVVVILMIWWLTRPSKPGDNQYGPPPQ